MAPNINIKGENNLIRRGDRLEGDKSPSRAPPLLEKGVRIKLLN